MYSQFIVLISFYLSFFGEGAIIFPEYVNYWVPLKIQQKA